MHGKIKEYIPADNPNKDTPIFMGHGDADPLVIYEWGQMTAQALKDMGWTVNFNTYKGLAHSAEPKEMDDLEAYIRERLPPLGGKASSADWLGCKELPVDQKIVEYAWSLVLVAAALWFGIKWIIRLKKGRKRD